MDAIYRANSAKPRRVADRREPPAGGLPSARLRLLATRIHSLGPRPLYELLLELQNGAPLDERLEAYARVAPLAPFIAALDSADLPTLRLINDRVRPAQPRAKGRRQ